MQKFQGQFTKRCRGDDAESDHSCASDESGFSAIGEIQDGASSGAEESPSSESDVETDSASEGEALSEEDHGDAPDAPERLPPLRVLARGEAAFTSAYHKIHSRHPSHEGRLNLHSMLIGLVAQVVELQVQQALLLI